MEEGILDEAFLAELDRLEAVGRMQDLDFAGVVVRIATDRFCALKSSSRLDIDRFVSIMDRALERAAPEEVARVSGRIASRGDLPERLLWRLTLSGPQAATIALRAAPRPSMRLLLARAEHGSVEEAAAIAARADLDRSVVMAIVRRTEPEPMRALVANAAAPLDRALVLALVQRARFDEPLARALLARGVVGLEMAPLFLTAARDARRRIMIEAQQDSLDRAGRGAGPLEGVRDKALAAARAGNARAFATQIALPLRSNRSAIDRMVEDRGGEPLALLFAALGAEVAQALDAIGMLRPALDIEESSGAMLALQSNVHAASRLVRAIVHGALKAPDAPREHASAAREAGVVARRQFVQEKAVSRG
ncbi:MAG: DUF2336 domain-containing protein [Beijerinckiaceae bacterium]